MVDLRQMEYDVQLQELYAHVGFYEGLINHFYCDDATPRGFVTIGIGELVDSRRATSKAAARVVAGDWYRARRGWIVFSHKRTRARANEQQILADWERIFDAGMIHVGDAAGTYEPIALYRISDQHAYRLKSVKVFNFLRVLYDTKKLIIQPLDVYIHMAIIDTRFQSFGIVLYGTSPRIERMWNLMNRNSPDYNLPRAALLFEYIWRNFGAADTRKRRRIEKRVYWFRLGIERMLQRNEPVSHDPASPTASGYGRNMQSFNRMSPVRGGQRRRGSIGHA